ncbi:MAG: aminoacyl--tRNA ligase-related protein [Candidatus Nezhaarchaeales archaeon]
MRFRLKASIEFSTPIESAKNEINEALNLASPLLTKGTPKGKEGEGAKLVNWLLAENKLKLELESGRYVRAHDALLRLKKYLAERLGSRLKVGVRGLIIDEYEISIPRDEVAPSVDAQKIIGATGTVILKDSFLVLTFQELTERDILDRVIDRALKLLIRPKVVPLTPKATLVSFGYVLKSSPPKSIKFREEVSVVAEKLGWIKRFPARGQWILTAPITALLKAIRDLITNKVCIPLDFQEWFFPRLLPFSVLEKLSTYVEHLPEGMFYVCTPPRDPEAFEEFKKEYALRRILRTDLLKSILPPPSYVLDAVQCPPFYQFFSGELVRAESLPIKVFDCMGGWTWRNEAGGVEGLARTNEFWRMEMVYLGTPDQVVEIRDKIVEATIELVNKDLELEWRLTVGAPFYLAPEEAKKRTIDISSSKSIPALDIECYLPYRGPREQSEWLEISSCNIHMQHYVKAFKIREVKGKELWTGCTGHGLTRWATAILAQYGFDFDEWPKTLRNTIKKLPQPIKIVTWP